MQHIDETSLYALKKAVMEEDITGSFPYLIDLVLEFDRDVPQKIISALDATGKDWHYYYIMIRYAIQWYSFGSSPSKLKRLMDEAIQELRGPEHYSGKRSATKMFMDYLQYKKNIDAYLKQRLGQ